MLCKDCENFRFPSLLPQTQPPAPMPVSVSCADAQSSARRVEQIVQVDSDQSTKQHCAGAVTSEANNRLPGQTNLVQCELMYFVLGCYGQHPDSTVRFTVLEFFRDDEILAAKQLLVHAAERIENLNIQSFVKKRTGANKCRSSVDDIYNIVKAVDEHSCLDKLPTFCAVSRMRVPVIAEELSDMAAIRLELNQLRQHVETLAKQLSHVSRCESFHSKQTVVDSSQHSDNLSEPVQNVPTNIAKSRSSASTVGNVAATVNRSTATLADHESVENIPVHNVNTDSVDTNCVTASGSSAATFADHAKSLQKDDFQEYKNKKKEKQPARKRFVVGDSVHDTGFKGIAKMSVFCVGRLEHHTTAKVIEDYLQSKNIHVFSCFRVKPRVQSTSRNDDTSDHDHVDGDGDGDVVSAKFANMRVCIAQCDSQKFLSSDLWPKGIIVRPWVFKPKQ